MFLSEPKMPFSDSSNPRASGVLQKEEVLNTSITVPKDQIRTFDQQTHLLRGMLQNESLLLDKLRDYGLPRSALPPSRAALTGLSRRSRSRVGRAHDKANRLPLGRRRRPKKRKSHQNQAQHLRKATRRTHRSLLAEAALHFRVLTDSMAGSSAVRSWTSDAVRLAEGPANKIQLRSNKHPKAILNQNTRQKKSEAHLSQYAPRAHLRAAEAYSDSFRD